MSEPCPIVHVEIPAPDIKKAESFYTNIFGWKTEAMGEEYSVFTWGGDEGGGFSAGSKPTEDSGVIAYIKVQDINEALGRIGEAGGATMMEKTLISEEHGYFAIFKDPNGNRMGIWSKT